MSDTLVVNEIFLSLQGESTFAGLPCVFIRLTGCPLRCSYCDTAYAFTGGHRMTLEQVLAEVRELAQRFKPNAPIVEVTGGEPLAQPNCLRLLNALCDEGFTVLLETSGALDIGSIDPRVRRIVDLKCPSSGEIARNRWENIPLLRPTDEIKFVLGTQEDYEWAKDQIAAYRLAGRCSLLFSLVSPLTPEQQDRLLKPIPPGQTAITRQQLAERVLADGLPVRFQLQMHKLIWPSDQRGV